MPVFKAYFKVIKKVLPSLMIYFVVFLAVSIIFLSSGAAKTADLFDVSKSSIAFYNDDEPSALVDGLRAYLADSTIIVDLPDSKEALQDALFYGKITYILRVPQGFAESFRSGGDVKLLKTTAPGSTNSVAVDMLIDKYFNLVRLYQTNLPDMPQDQVIGSVLKDLSQSVPVELKATAGQQKTAVLADYFRYQAYPIIAILIMGITAIMMAFNDPEVSRRNQCAPIRPMKMSLSMFFGNTVFAVAVWFALCLIALILNRSYSLTPSVLLLCLNALIFTIVSLTIGFLAGKFVKSPIAQSALTNVISLGVSFLSGVFMDQSMLGDTVLKIASFLPGYWYVKAVNTIRELGTLDFASLKPVFDAMLIQLAFAAACIVIALVASKQKRQSANS